MTTVSKSNNTRNLSSRNFVSISQEIHFLDVREKQVSSLVDNEQTSLEGGNKNNNAPEVILIFAWMGASQGSIIKFTDKYTQLYPNASQIVVQCFPAFFFISQAQMRTKLRPLVDLLQSFGVLPSEVEERHDQPRLLVHVFSNGGATCLSILAQMVRSPAIPSPQQQDQSRQDSDDEGGRGTKTTLIIDSSPGHPSIQGSLAAFTATIRNRMLRTLSYLFFAPGLCLWAAFNIIFLRRSSFFDLLFGQIASPTIGGIPFMGSKTKRLYLYGKRDKLIPWRDVVENAALAREKGVEQVEEEAFEMGEHLTHAKMDPERYWGAVVRLVASS